MYSVADAKSTQLTDGLSDARYPVFDKDGKYLYFTASTDIGPSLEPDIRSATRTVTRSVYITVLSKTDPSPFAPESDEEKPTPDKPGPDKPAPDKTDPDKPAQADQPEAARPEQPKPEAKPGGPPPKPPEVRIDFDRIGQRILAMPLPARRYVGLQAGKGGTLFAVESPPPGPGVPPGTTVHRHDLKLRRSDVVATGVRFFEISANGEKTLTAQANRWSIQTLRPMAPVSPGAAAATPPVPPLPSAGGPVERGTRHRIHRGACRTAR